MEQARRRRPGLRLPRHALTRSCSRAMVRAWSCGPLAVVDGATVVGVVTVDDIQRWLSRRPRRTSLTNKAEDPPVGDQRPFQRLCRFKTNRMVSDLGS